MERGHGGGERGHPDSLLRERTKGGFDGVGRRGSGCYAPLMTQPPAVALLGALVTLAAVVALHGSLRAAPTQYFGPYRGVVVDVDPATSRIKAEVPSVSATESGWALPCSPYTNGAPPALPPIGAQVWIEYERGDVHFPVWTGWRAH